MPRGGAGTGIATWMQSPSSSEADWTVGCVRDGDGDGENKRKRKS